MTSPKLDTATLPERNEASDLYERDFYRWTLVQARALRESRWHELDWENLAEEVESVGRNDRRAVRSHLEILLAHLLKCMVQPSHRTASWDRTIKAQRAGIAALIDRSPSLRSLPADRFDEAYASAVFLAYRDTGISEDQFPPKSPFTLEQALAPDFFPGPMGEGDR